MAKNSVSLREYYEAMRVSDQRALELQHEADQVALNLAREQQTYKDQVHNGLLDQLTRERSAYVTQSEHEAVIAKFDAAIKPLQEFMVSQIASGAGVRDYRSEARQIEELRSNVRQASASSPFRSNLAVTIAALSVILTTVVGILVLLHK
jgi:hypothetical protein